MKIRIRCKICSHIRRQIVLRHFTRLNTLCAAVHVGWQKVRNVFFKIPSNCWENCRESYGERLWAHHVYTYTEWIRFARLITPLHPVVTLRSYILRLSNTVLTNIRTWLTQYHWMNNDAHTSPIECPQWDASSGRSTNMSFTATISSLHGKFMSARNCSDIRFR